MSITTVEPTEMIQRAPSVPMIYGALARVKRDMPAVPKARETESGPKYSYRSAEDIVNAASPLFAREGITVVPYLERASRELRERGNNGTMVFSIVESTLTFYAEDGSFVTAKVIGEASDVSDKASTKAQTVAYRIGVAAILSIPTKETTIDPEAGNQPEGTTQAAAERATTTLRASRNVDDFKKVLKYVLKCAAGKGKAEDNLQKPDIEPLRLVSLEVAKRFRVNEDATQWIDDQFSAAASFTESQEDSTDVQMDVEPVHLGEVTDLLASIKDENAEDILCQVVGLYPQMKPGDQDQVRTAAANFSLPAFRLWVQMEIATVEELPGEIRGISASEASGLIEQKTKAVLIVRANARLSQLKKGKK
jgi:hypothetical protein